FFFSSRRRHTSFSRDWSSDVCSSDLALEQALAATVAAEAADARLRAYEKTGALAGNPRANVRDLVEAAHAAAGIDAHDYELLRRRGALRDQGIRGDDFPFDFGRSGDVEPRPRREAAWEPAGPRKPAA